MGTVFVPNGIISTFNTVVKCPQCEQEFDAIEYDEKLNDAKRSYIKIKCPHCKRFVGLTSGMLGDFIVFELSTWQQRLKRKSYKKSLDNP